MKGLSSQTKQSQFILFVKHACLIVSVVLSLGLVGAPFASAEKIQAGNYTIEITHNEANRSFQFSVEDYELPIEVEAIHSILYQEFPEILATRKLSIEFSPDPSKIFELTKLLLLNATEWVYLKQALESFVKENHESLKKLLPNLYQFHDSESFAKKHQRHPELGKVLHDAIAMLLFDDNPHSVSLSNNSYLDDSYYVFLKLNLFYESLGWKDSFYKTTPGHLKYARDFEADLRANRLLPPIKRKLDLKKSDTLSADEVLIVTHATRTYDYELSAKAGIDQEIRHMRQRGAKIVYVIGEDGMQDWSWYTSDRQPDLAVHSPFGDHSLNLKAKKMSFVGGFLSECLERALIDAIKNRIRQVSELAIRIPMHAVYVGKYELRNIPQLQTLGTAYEQNGEAWLEKYLKELFFTEESDNTGMYTLLENHEAEVFFDGKFSFRIGQGPHRLRFDFVSK